MNNNNYSKETDWISREKRELFCKSVNSLIMTRKDIELEDALADAKSIVDTAFANYPDSQPVSNWKDPVKEPLIKTSVKGSDSPNTPF